METIFNILSNKVEAGYRLTDYELRQFSSEIKDQYLLLVCQLQPGLNYNDMVHFSSTQEKEYKKLRSSYFDKVVYVGTLCLHDFLKLTEMDKRIYIKCIAKANMNLPENIFMALYFAYANVWNKHENKHGKKQKNS